MWDPRVTDRWTLPSSAPHTTLVAREEPSPSEPRDGESPRLPHPSTGSERPVQGPWEDGQGGRGRDRLPPGTGPLAHLGTGLLWPSHPAEGSAQEGSPGTRSPSSSSSESSGQDSGVEPLLSVTWLWPEGWSLALRSHRSGPGPWRDMEPLGSEAPHTHHTLRWPVLQLQPWGPAGGVAVLRDSRSFVPRQL